jgi:mono/diheme cytochrome c family protein
LSAVASSCLEQRDFIIMRFLFIIIPYTFLLLSGACGSTKSIASSEPAQPVRGEHIYQTSCKSCHSGGEGGVGPLFKTRPTNRFYKMFEAKHGLGRIGNFEGQKLTNVDLKAIASYIAAQ